MFTWICPKCGGEVPPSYNECPRCTGQSAKQASPAPPAPPPLAADRTPAPPAPPPPSPVPAVAPAPVQVQAAPAAAAPSPAAPPPAPARQKRSISPAVVGICAALGIVALLGLLYFYVLPRKPAETAASPAPVQNAAAPQNRHPLAKHLEIVGVRIVESSGGSARIQFLVVNHSAADLPDMTMNVTLKAGDRTLFTFPATLPSLGPYEYRELTTSVKTELKPYEMPDWQVLRPEFQLTSAP